MRNVQKIIDTLGGLEALKRHPIRCIEDTPFVRCPNEYREM
jgi:hypothetical protein